MGDCPGLLDSCVLRRSPGVDVMVRPNGEPRGGLTARLVADAVLGKGGAEPAFDPARFA